MRIEIEDVQGIVLRGYGSLEHACFVLLRLGETAAARHWLRSVAGEVKPASAAPRDSSVNLALGYRGLEKLGLSERELEGFSHEFEEGMAGDPYRSRILGDREESAPERWTWGYREKDPDAALLLYASDATGLDRLYDRHRSDFARAGIEEIVKLETRKLLGRKEHFGFRDGIGQPCLENRNPEAEQVGVLEPGRASNTVAPGEFLLGYPDAYGKIAPGPLIDPDDDPTGRLPADAGGSGRRDLGRNGSYLVLRQLQQDVHAFWSFAARNTPSDREPVALAAKIVGRWPNGTPLVKAPEREPHGHESDDDEFLYTGDGDPHGYRCPLGSHVRRANPRDSFVAGKTDSLEIANRHRLIRRGRPYGEPIDGSMDWRRILAAGDPGGERGLQFLAFNAHIRRQFEFVQQNWLNNPKFAALYDDKDPMVGDCPLKGAGLFTQQGHPVPRIFESLPRFVTVRGGAYLFVPGLKALDFLANRDRRGSKTR